MRAVAYHGKRDVRVDTVPDPRIEEPTDAIVRVTSSGICGSDLHLYEVLGAFMDEGDILGHEPMGIVEEVGSDVKQIKPGSSARASVGWRSSTSTRRRARNRTWPSSAPTKPSTSTSARGWLRRSSGGELGQVTKQRVHPGDLVEGALAPCTAAALQQRWERVELIAAVQSVAVAAGERECFPEHLVDGPQPAFGVR